MAIPMIMSWCPGQKCDPCDCKFYPTPGPGQDIGGTGQHLQFQFVGRPLCVNKVALVILSTAQGSTISGLNWYSHSYVTGGFPTPDPPVINYDGESLVVLVLDGIEIFTCTITGSGTQYAPVTTLKADQSIDTPMRVESAYFVTDAYGNVIYHLAEAQQGFVYTGPANEDSVWDLIFYPGNSQGSWSTLPDNENLWYAPVNPLS